MRHVRTVAVITHPLQLVSLKAKVAELQENEHKSIQEAESLRLTMQNTVSGGLYSIH